LFPVNPTEGDEMAYKSAFSAAVPAARASRDDTDTNTGRRRRKRRRRRRRRRNTNT
jgi:hypothetical protein